MAYRRRVWWEVSTAGYLLLLNQSTLRFSKINCDFSNTVGRECAYAFDASWSAASLIGNLKFDFFAKRLDYGKNNAALDSERMFLKFAAGSWPKVKSKNFLLLSKW